jgi:hypothetical protein
MFTLFALVFFMIGITLFGIGLLGEYVGRIYQQVRHRPRYLVEGVLEKQQDAGSRKQDAAKSGAVDACQSQMSDSEHAVINP